MNSKHYKRIQFNDWNPNLSTEDVVDELREIYKSPEYELIMSRLFAVIDEIDDLDNDRIVNDNAYQLLHVLYTYYYKKDTEKLNSV